MNNSFTINLALCDSKGTALQQCVSFRSHDDGSVELVLVSKKAKGANEEKSLGFVPTANLAKTINAALMLAGSEVRE